MSYLGASPSCTIHEYTGSFNGQKAKFKMTSVCGHVMTLDFKGHFNNWDAVQPVSLILVLSWDSYRVECTIEQH